MATWDMFWEKAGKGFADAYSKADDRRARKKELKEERDIRAKELAAALKERQEAAREARHARTDERNWLLSQKDADRAYDELKKQDEARRKVAGFDPKIREQVSQAPSLIRSDAPSLPLGKDELGYDHPFKGSPDLVEDVVRSLKEEEGEVDWLAAAARGTRIQTMADKAKEDARVNREARERVIFSNTLEALGNEFLAAGEEGIDFTPVDEGVSGMPEHLQKSYYDRGVSSTKIGEAKSAKGFLLEQRKILLQEGAGLASWGYEPINPKTDVEVSDAYASISIAKAKKNLFDTQQKVFGTPPNLTPMGRPEILNLTAGEVNNLTRKWSEALEAQRIKTIGAEAKAKSDATTLTPEQEVEREQEIAALRMQQNLPEFTPALHYGAPTDKFGTPLEGQDKVVKGYYPNFAPYIAKTGKYPTQDQIYAATKIMESQGLHVIQKVPKGWVDPREAPQPPQPTQPPKSDLYDPEVPPARMPREGAGLSDTLRQGLMPPQEPPREVDINTLTDEEVSNIATYPEGKPFKTGSGVWFIRRGFKLIEVEPPLGPVE